MGKPLSRPDCLRQNPTCVGKGEEEDLNIDDCYVPQRSIYDTVRLNEQIDSGSKGSLSSRHFVGTLPYTHRTLDLSTLCGNGVLTSSSAFELRAREASRFDERAVFDGLKLNGDVIRGAGTMLAKSRASGERGSKEQPQHRRSWRTFAPTHLNEYASRSGTLSTDGGGSGSGDRRDPRSLLNRDGRGRSIANSLTSEDDSGLCSPTAERDKRRQRAQRRAGPGTRSLSSTEAVHVSGELRPGRSLSSGQEEFPFSPAKEPVPTSRLYNGSPQQTRDSCVIDLSGVDRVLTNGDRTDSKGSIPSIPSLPSGSGSGSGSSRRMRKERRSRTFAGYEELPTAELLEDTLPQDDEELTSVVVTQPEMCTDSGKHELTEPDETSYDIEQSSLEYNIADIEDFLLALANGVHPIYKHMGEEEIASMLATIAAMDTSQLDLSGFCPPQVSRNSLVRTAASPPTTTPPPHPPSDSTNNKFLSINVPLLISASWEPGLWCPAYIRLPDG